MVTPKAGEGFQLWKDPSASQRNRLLEFKAGKMYVRDNLVHPDTRKGLVYIFQDDEGDTHFCWMDRSRGLLEDDFITRPHDCLFKRINKCTTGRVYMLKFISSSTVRFYWMQEPSSENDEANCNKVNSLLNFPGPRIHYPEQVFTNELQFILNQLNAEQLQALYNGGDIVWVDTRNQLAEHEEMPASPSNSTPAPDPFVNLAEVIDGESIKGITKSPALMKKVVSKLPSIEGDQKENLEKTVKSAPFQYAIENFSMALKMGALGPALTDLNVNSAAVSAAEKGDVDSFMKALQGGAAAAPQKKGGGPSGGGPGNSGSPQADKSSPDMSTNEQNKQDESSKKHKSQQENTNYREDKEQPGRKRAHGSNTPGVMKVNTSQQTKPIRITPIDKVAGSDSKITTTLTQLRLDRSDDGMTYDRGQNTDPVRIEKLGSMQTPDKCGEGSRAITSDLEQKQEPNEDKKLHVAIDTQETQHKRRRLSEFLEGETNIMSLSEAIKHKRTEKEKSQLGETTNNQVGNWYQPIKRTQQEMAKSNESFQESETKKMKIVHSSELNTADKIITKQSINTARLTDAIGTEVTKVEGEQQTEPVIVRPTVHSKAEAKITTRKTTSRGSNQRDTQASTERSQNTDPVRIEEKQKRQHKPKDPKPPESDRSLNEPK